MRTNYGPIIFSFRSHEPKETAIAGRLQDDVNVPEASASAVAKILVSVSKEAELIDENGRFDPTAIEDTKAELEAAGDEPARVVLPAEPKSSEARVSKTPAGAPSKQTNGKSRETGGATGKGDGECAPLATAPVQVVVNVDASKLGPQEIAALVRALREPTPKDT
jgi:hypothetical protein